MMPEFEYTRIVQRKRTILHLTMKNMTCVVVAALCNQPEDIASYISDDQSHCLSSLCCLVITVCGMLSLDFAGPWLWGKLP